MPELRHSQPTSLPIPRARDSLYTRRGKRLFDATAAGVLLVLTAPVQALVAVAVKRNLGSPVLFRQQRPGLDGEPFEMLKFRTMTNERDATGELLPESQRLTRLGQFLRSTSLDELPELINVVRGELSLVGPRPLLVKYLDRYTPRQTVRHAVRPGVTGLAQVSGRNALSWEEKFEFDIQYVERVSLGLDLKILALTVWHVLARRGISAEGHATMPEFSATAAA